MYGRLYQLTTQHDERGVLTKGPRLTGKLTVASDNVKLSYLLGLVAYAMLPRHNAYAAAQYWLPIIGGHDWQQLHCIIHSIKT